PLRGWFGDAMATEMALAQLQHQQPATKIIANHAHKPGAEAHFNHETAASKATDAVQAVQIAHDCAGQPAGEASHAADAQCESCSACQACHTVALSSAAAKVNPVFSAFTRPRAAAAQFASAEAALGQKPPIS
ncbi:MAG: hypothetical protein ACREXN_06770, partial [Polaromonas sp.]